MVTSEQVEVPVWLQPWWEFWHNFTIALYWPAWSAAFSAAALFWAIYLANGNGRRERSRDAAMMRSVADRLTAISTMFRLAYEESEKGTTDWDVIMGAASDMANANDYAGLLDTIKVDKLPSAKAIDLALGGRVKFKGMLNRLQSSQSNPPFKYTKAKVLEDIEAVESIVERLKQEEIRLKDGPVWAWMRRLLPPLHTARLRD